MSNAQKENMTFITNTFVKVMLGVSGALLTMLVIEMRTDIKEQGADINRIKVDMATVKGYMRYSDK